MNAIAWSRIEDVERIALKPGVEYTHRLITEAIHGSSFSFHITRFDADYEHVARGDGEHESVLFCLHGGSTQTLPDGTVHHFRPGDAMYLPKEHEYHHVIGPSGLVMAVSCTPSR
ncbi:MAG: ectoine synthase [Microbacterium sp.]|jgi:L-ectoine synthase|uniref:ectoine synthase n=1 Tax=Microbacterium sp. TaxID=51671 RepID=UPI002838E9D3|nr:ectoine synthase [Microbacterium sp.]MDR2321811.1 ectoine synthase [Microbacterium sp.]